MNFLSLNCVIKKYITVLENIITFEDATYAPICKSRVGGGGGGGSAGKGREFDA